MEYETRGRAWSSKTKTRQIECALSVRLRRQLRGWAAKLRTRCPGMRGGPVGRRYLLHQTREIAESRIKKEGGVGTADTSARQGCRERSRCVVCKTKQETRGEDCSFKRPPIHQRNSPQKSQNTEAMTKSRGGVGRAHTRPRRRRGTGAGRDSSCERECAAGGTEENTRGGLTKRCPG